MAHTPGPWLIAGEDKTFVYALGRNGINSFWAHVQAAGSERVSESEKAANARLIAAAPELLAALRVAEYAMRIELADPEDTGAYQAVIQAIANATGSAA